MLAPEQHPEGDRDDRVDVGVGRDHAERRVREQPDVGGVADDRPEGDQVDPAEDRGGRRGEVMHRERRDGQHHEPAGEHLERRRRERVVGHRQARRDERADRPHHRRDHAEHDAPGVRAARRLGQDRHSAEADPHPGEHLPRQPLARQPQHHHPERHRSDDQRRQPGRDVPLGEEQHGVGARQEAPHEHARRERAPRGAERPAAGPHDERHQGAGDHEPSSRPRTAAESSRRRTRSRGTSTPRSRRP